MVAAFKGVKHEVIEVHLKKKPRWFLEEINPFGLVPVIEHNKHIIRESAITFGMDITCTSINESHVN